MIKYTPEQHDVLDFVQANDGIVLVAAGAGSGKTFLAKQITLLLKPFRGLYTAFNKAIVKEGEATFRGTNMECRTLHGLAYQYVQPKNEISGLSYKCIEEDISYKLKYEVIHAIDMFYVSSSVDMFEFFEEYFEKEPKKKLCIELSVKYVEKMINKELPPSFNFMLKYFHLLLVSGAVECEYDLVILDEINDTTAVALEIFKLIKAPKKICLGETHQAIYDFLNLVNGFELLEDAPIMNLTQSFRCSEQIAESIQSFMRKEVTDKFTFTGTDEPVKNNKRLHVTLTNAKIVEEIAECIEDGKGFHLLRKLSEIFAYPLAITSAAAGKEVYQKQYKHLEEEYENYARDRRAGYSFLQHLMDFVDDQETKSAVNLLLLLKRRNINLFDLYAKAKKAEVDTNYTIATVYTSKGLEFETVFISNDLNHRIGAIRENGGIKNNDDLVAYRCYYVAASRAGCNLLNATVLKD